MILFLFLFLYRVTEEMSISLNRLREFHAIPGCAENSSSSLSSFPYFFGGGWAFRKQEAIQPRLALNAMHSKGSYWIPDPPASVSQVLGLHVSTTISGFSLFLLYFQQMCLFCDTECQFAARLDLPGSWILSPQLPEQLGQQTRHLSSCLRTLSVLICLCPPPSTCGAGVSPCPTSVAWHILGNGVGLSFAPNQEHRKHEPGCAYLMEAVLVTPSL